MNSLVGKNETFFKESHPLFKRKKLLTLTFSHLFFKILKDTIFKILKINLFLRNEKKNKTKTINNNANEFDNNNANATTHYRGRHER